MSGLYSRKSKSYYGFCKYIPKPYTLNRRGTVRALIIRIGFGVYFTYNLNKEPPKTLL